MKYTLILVFLLAATLLCHAQQPYSDSVKVKKVRKANHYTGVQVNQLLNQIFNFGGGSTPAVGTYLLTYAVNSKKTGWGFNSGIGYNINSTTDNSDPNTSRKTTIDNFQLRLGVEKKTYVSKRWLTSYGFDVIWGKEKNDTNVSSQFQTSTDTNISTRTAGFGPRLGLNFVLSEHILLGTEVSYYLQFLKDSTKTVNTNQTNQGTDSSTTTTNDKVTSFAFTSPTLLYIIVKI